MIWSAPGVDLAQVPVFRTYLVDDPAITSAIDALRRGREQFFACQIKGGQFDFPAGHGLAAAHHDWWALTQGDQHNLWGFVSEVYLWGGPDYMPDPGISRICTAADLSRVPAA
jgi:hypothetical protein